MPSQLMALQAQDAAKGLNPRRGLGNHREFGGCQAKIAEGFGSLVRHVPSGSGARLGEFRSRKERVRNLRNERLGRLDEAPHPPPPDPLLRLRAGRPGLLGVDWREGSGGYGSVKIATGKSARAHRVAWTLVRGPRCAARASAPAHW